MVKLVLTGATGLVGGEVLRAALAQTRVTEVVALGRRPTGLGDSKLREIEIADFLDLTAARDAVAGAGLCCHCLATYIHRVGRAAYRRITIDYLANLIAELERGAPEAALVTFTTEGTRQDGGSWVRTLNVKGEAERLVLEANLPRRYVLRPGYIHPTRPRARPIIYDWIMRPVFRLMPSLGIESADLGRVMLETGLEDDRPEAVIGNREIRFRARQ